MRRGAAVAQRVAAWRVVATPRQPSHVAWAAVCRAERMSTPHVALRGYADTPVKLGKLAESLVEGEVGDIHVQVGDVVAVDQLLFSIETDKAAAPVNAPSAGTVKKILVQKGDVVAVGADLLILSSDVAPGASTAAPPKPKNEEGKPKEAPPPPAKAVSEASAKVAPPTATVASKPPPKPTIVQAAATTTTERESRVRLSKMRRVIAGRLKDAQNTYAMLTTFQECDMSNLFALRAQFGEQFAKKHGGVKLGFMSAFVKAAGCALKESPEVNGVIDGEDVVYRNYVDISVAVASPKGLVVPVIRDVDRKSFADIERDIAALGAKAKDGSISVEEMTGGTFTISNGGVFGSLFGTPIINPPQSAILGMHGINKRPVVVNDQIVIRPIMILALTYDHRLIDGREGVTFLRRVKQLVEDPARIVLDV